MQKSQKLTASIVLIGCIAYGLFFSDPVYTALVFILYACILMYLFSKRKLPVFSRIKIMIAAWMFSIVMTAVCIAAAELLRGYFLFDGVLMGCMMCLGLGAVIQTAFLIMQEFLPDVVQVVLLVLAGLYLLNIGVFSIYCHGICWVSRWVSFRWKRHCLQVFTGCACIFRTDDCGCFHREERRCMAFPIVEGKAGCFKS